MIDLKKKKLFLLDMDGTIYLGDHLFDGTIDFLKQVKASGGRYLFVTNNSSRSTGGQVYFKFVGSDTAHADRPRHGSDHGRRERPIPDKGGRTDSAWLPEEGRRSKCPEADTRNQNGCAGG